MYQREKPLCGNQTQKIHYSEEIASYKIIIFTNPFAIVVH
jgi:hypothetical protein